MTVDESPRLLCSELRFPESPRWFDDKLWLSDLESKSVVTVTLDGTLQTVAEFDDSPSGSGFLPDGSLLVVLRTTRRIVRVHEGLTSPYADLSDIPGDHLNDMVVDGTGRTFVDNCYRRRVTGNTGRLNDDLDSSDLSDGIIFVGLDGDHRIVAQGDVICPNGMAIAADGKTLIVAESLASRLSAFSVQSDGSLSDRQIYAHTGGFDPDGIALDSEGAVWMGSPAAGQFFRVLPGGDIVASIQLPKGRWAVACALGGPQRRHLFLVSAEANLETRAREESKGFLEVLEVAVPGVGWP
jgi:sugar lactone lactonase YvrE